MLIVRRDAGQIILNIRNSFDEEAVSSKRLGLQNITQRVMMATNAGWVTASAIRTQRDVDLLPAATFTVTRIRKTKISDEFAVKIRQALRYCITVNKQLPIIDMVLSYLTQEEISPCWTYSRETLYRYMIGKGFQFTDPQNHYEYTKERDNVTTISEKYLLWLQKYRSEN